MNEHPEGSPFHDEWTEQDVEEWEYLVGMLPEAPDQFMNPVDMEAAWGLLYSWCLAVKDLDGLRELLHQAEINPDLYKEVMIAYAVAISIARRVMVEDI